MDENEKRLDLNDESGITRRDVLRRGAIVGGTLLWVAPAIQSMAPKALALTQGPSPGQCAACYCWNGAADKSVITLDQCLNNGVALGGKFSHDDCENWCKHNAPYNVSGGAGNGPYAHSEYCSGAIGSPNSICSCSTSGPFPSRGVECAP